MRYGRLVLIRRFQQRDKNGGAWALVESRLFSMLNLLLDFVCAIAYNVRMQVSINTVCKGDGYWSREYRKRVLITDISLDYCSADGDFGELLAYFDHEEWSIARHGLIYTDRGWMKSFKQGLRRYGFSWEAINDVDYSEQGMQGANFVSMDVGMAFINEYQKLKESYEASDSVVPIE